MRNQPDVHTRKTRDYGAIRLVTQRLVLRPVRLEDIASLFAMYADEEVMRYIAGAPFQGTLEELQGRIRAALAGYHRDGFGLLATELRETGEIIGRCGHMRWNVEGNIETEVGYLFARSHWGKGYATEAARALIDDGFANLGVSRIISLIHPENVASQRVAAHNGLRFEREVSIPEIPIAPIRLYAIEASAWPP